MDVIANLIEDNRAGDAGAGSDLPRSEHVRRQHRPATRGGRHRRGMDRTTTPAWCAAARFSGKRPAARAAALLLAVALTGPVIENVTIANTRRGAVAACSSTTTSRRVTLPQPPVTGNRAGYGGGLMVRATNLTLRSSVFAGNVATRQGGAIFTEVNSAWNEPLPPAPPLNPVVNIDFVVMHGNTAPEGAAVWTDVANLSIENSIVARAAPRCVMPRRAADAPPAPSPSRPRRPALQRHHPATFSDGRSDRQHGNISRTDVMSVADQLNRCAAAAPASRRRPQ